MFLEKIMRELNLNEVSFVFGGMIAAPGGSLAHPINNAESEYGKMINDAAGALNDFGSWLGGKIYDWTH